MAEQINFKVTFIDRINQLTNDMSRLLSSRKDKIGVKFVKKFFSDISQAMTDGIDGQTNHVFSNIDTTIETNTESEQLNSPSSQETPTQTEKTVNEENIESRVRRIEIETKKIGKLVEKLIEPKTDHVFRHNNNYQSSRKFPKTCFICHKVGHISTYCWFNSRKANYNSHNNYSYVPNQRDYYRKPYFQRHYNQRPNNQNFDGMKRQNDFLFPRRPQEFRPQYWTPNWNQNYQNDQNHHQVFKNLGTSFQTRN